MAELAELSETDVNDLASAVEKELEEEKAQTSTLGDVVDALTTSSKTKRRKQRAANCFVGSATRYFHLNRPDDLKQQCAVGSVKIKPIPSAITHVSAQTLESLTSACLLKNTERNTSNGRIVKPYTRLGHTNRGRIYAEVVSCVHVFTELADKTIEGHTYIPTDTWDEASDALRKMDTDFALYLSQLQGTDEGQEQEEWETEVISESG